MQCRSNCACVLTDSSGRKPVSSYHLWPRRMGMWHHSIAVHLLYIPCGSLKTRTASVIRTTSNVCYIAKIETPPCWKDTRETGILSLSVWYMEGPPRVLPHSSNQKTTIVTPEKPLLTVPMTVHPTKWSCQTPCLLRKKSMWQTLPSISAVSC